MTLSPNDNTAAVDAEIWHIYRGMKQAIRESATFASADLCLERVYDLLMFMNRFRNCDLQGYFDEEIHSLVASLNPHRYDTSHLLRPKRDFKIAFVAWALSDTGGASLPHRFILEKYDDDGLRFQQYVLLTNTKRITGSKSTAGYEYLKKNIDLVEVCDMDAGGSWVQRGEFIQQWIFEREIDFVVYNPEPSVLYAIASRPALLHGVLSQDCYTFTLGPGTGDFTFLVTTDQVFKYRFVAPDAEKHLKIIMLPLHRQEYIDSAAPYTKAELGLAEDTVLSATTNMWKCCFGDSELLLEGIATLMRRFPKYHHIFAGTPRCLDSVEFFLNKNPDVRQNIHYIGPVKNIYRLLKAIDFYVNSFPTSGGSDIESAMVGKPSIEFLANRNLNLHGCEFLRSRECDVVSLDEFVELGTRLISDPEYREDLGRFLKAKISREFDKSRIVKERIYDLFVSEFDKRLRGEPGMPAICLDHTLDYEKRIGLYNAYGRENWSSQKRRVWLTECISGFPDRPFGWIKSLEEIIRTQDAQWFRQLLADMPDVFSKDYRVQVMLALAYNCFGEREQALAQAVQAVRLATYDESPRRIAARLLAASDRLEEAAKMCPKTTGEHVDVGNVRSALAKLPEDSLPLYYNY